MALGASEVTAAYRRSRNDAPCGLFEIERTEELGVKWKDMAAPVRVLGQDRVEGVEVRIGEALETLAAEVLVTAIGESATPPFAKDLGLEHVRKGDVRWLNMTAIENVFVAGDALTGPSKIGKAVYSGLRAARSLANWLDLKSQNRQDEFQGDLIGPAR